MPRELLTLCSELMITQASCSGAFSCYGSTKRYVFIVYAPQGPKLKVLNTFSSASGVHSSSTLPSSSGMSLECFVTCSFADQYQCVFYPALRQPFGSSLRSSGTPWPSRSLDSSSDPCSRS